MTRAYLLSAATSRSSIGGLVMPSGDATVPATQCSSSVGLGEARPASALGGAPSAAGHAERAWHESHALYEVVGGLVDVGVDDGHVELLLGRQLEPGVVEAALTLLGGLGPPADQPAHELLPRGRGQEDEQGARHR